MKVKFKKLHHSAVIPKYAREGDAGLDLTATHVNYDYEKEVMVIKTDLCVEIPDGYVGLLFPRSSISNTMFRLANSVGVIDSGYRGEIIFKFDLSTGLLKQMGLKVEGNTALKEYNVGDRVGQLVIIPYPKIEPIESDKLSETERGDKGFGSTNNK